MFTTGCSLRQSARFRTRMLVLLILAGFLFAIEMWRSRFATAQSFADSQEPASILPAAGGDVDPGFNASVFEPMGFSGGLARQSDGKTIVFGSFTSVNGTARDGVARLNTDGSLDTSFSPSPQANGTFGQVQALIVQSEGKIVLGGSFTSINGTARNNIARLNADGSIDPSFNPGTGPNFSVNALAVQSDGKIVIGGGFSNVNGTARQGIARLNADGSLDTSFDPGSGTDFNSASAVVLQTDGKILIGGLFDSVNGATHNSLARLNANGSLDSSFNPSATRGVFAGGVFGVAVQPDGKIVIMGGFTNVNGTARTAIARLNADGSLDTSFNPGSGANNSTVIAVALQTDGKTVIGARLNSVTGTGRNDNAGLNVDGCLDASFNPGSGTD